MKPVITNPSAATKDACQFIFIFALTFTVTQCVYRSKLTFFVPQHGFAD